MDHFLSWASQQGIRLHPDICIEKSNLGGYGVVSHAHIPEDTVVLHIPKASIFDLSSCMSHKTALEQLDPSRVSNIINSFLGCSENVSETLILRNYIWAYAGLSRSMDISFQPYIDLLEKTETLHLDASSAVNDSFLMHHLTRDEAVKRDYERAMAGNGHLREHLSFAQALQLHKAVISRVLEIPAVTSSSKIEESPKISETSQIGENESGSQHSGDFYTNVSLVPMLDFANHAQENDAVFDVDLATQDVVLRLIRPVHPNKEITISYDPRPDATAFLGTYGFVPSDAENFTWHIDKFDEIVSQITCRDQDYSLLAKWLHVVPTVTLTVGEGKLRVAPNPRLPLLFIEGITYYSNWDSETADLEEEYGIDDVSQAVAELKHHEQNSPLIPAGDTAFGALYHDTYVSVPHILQQTGNSDGLDPSILVQTAKFIRQAALVGLRDCNIGTTSSEAFVLYKAAKKSFLEKLMDLSEEEITEAIKEATKELA